MYHHDANNKNNLIHIVPNIISQPKPKYEEISHCVHTYILED